MEPGIHGTIQDPARKHPVLDIRHWERQFPIGENRDEGRSVYSPGGIARIEQSRRLAMLHGDLGPSVPADVFVWSDYLVDDRRWLTRLGGRPWRPKDVPWPKDATGMPLRFLGQICFADSKDLIPFQLPGEVALIFGQCDRGWATADDGSAIEWYPIDLVDVSEYPFEIPRHGCLPFCYQGVIHRTVQYTKWEAAEPPFMAAGFEDGGFGIRSMQATSIGLYSDLPQGWPFKEGDGNSLICTLSSFFFAGDWPLCDVPTADIGVWHNGRTRTLRSNGALELSVGDAGAIWMYRDKDGNFNLNESCG